MSISRRRSTRWRRPISRRSRACCPTSRCWWSASRPRSIRRARLQASMCCGCRCACCPPRSQGDAAGEIAPDHWDADQGALCRPCHRHRSRRYAPGLRAEDPRPRGVLAHRPRAREPEPRRRRPDLRQPSHLRRISCSGRRAALRAGTRRSRTCILSARPLGRAPERVQAQAICSPNSSAGGDRRFGRRSS